MKKLNYLLFALMFALFAMILTSCETTSDEPGNATGKIAIKITDAPMDYKQFKEVSINIDKVELRKYNPNGNGEIITVTDKPFTANMMNLVNGITKTLADANLQAGKYDMIKIYFSSTKMVLKNGKEYTRMMDYSSSWNNNNWNDNWGGMNNNTNMMMNKNNKSIDILIEPYFTIEEGMDETFLMDVDIKQSFNCNGVNYDNMNSGNWMEMSGYSFTPVMRFVRMADTGTVKGVIQSNNGKLSDVTVYLMRGNKIYATTHTDSNGNYKFIGVPQGNYMIDVEYEGYDVNDSHWNNNVQMQPGDIVSVNCTMTPGN